MLGQWDDFPIHPATQRIILKIVIFLEKTLDIKFIEMKTLFYSEKRANSAFQHQNALLLTLMRVLFEQRYGLKSRNCETFIPHILLVRVIVHWKKGRKKEFLGKTKQCRPSQLDWARTLYVWSRNSSSRWCLTGQPTASSITVHYSTSIM